MAGRFAPSTTRASRGDTGRMRPRGVPAPRGDGPGVVGARRFAGRFFQTRLSMRPTAPPDDRFAPFDTFFPWEAMGGAAAAADDSELSRGL